MNSKITSALAAGGLSACASSGLAAEPRYDTNSDFGHAFRTSSAWRSAGNGPSDAHSAPNEHRLNRYTLGFLGTRWVLAARGELPDTPTVEGNDLYVSDSGGSVWRLDARTGHPVWELALPTITGLSHSRSRVSPAIGRSTVVVGDQAAGTVYALSKANGHPVWHTTLATDQTAKITSSPVIVGNRVYVGVSSGQEGLAVSTPNYVPTFRGSIAALDPNDGHVLWQTYTVPPGFTGGAVWSSTLAVDPARHAVYLTSGNNYPVPAAVAACQTAAASPAALDACLPADDWIDSIVSVDSDTGAIYWGQRFQDADTWTVSCLNLGFVPATPCPSPQGPDFDFGAGANLFSFTSYGVRHDAVAAGQKSGVHWTLDRDTGKTLWATRAGPSGPLGGILWGTATDGRRVYVPSANSDFVDVTLVPSGRHTAGGFWSALDATTGKILWQTPSFGLQPPSGGNHTPPGAQARAVGSVTIAGDVLYGEDTAGFLIALDAATGRIIRSVQSGGAAIAAPVVVNGAVYWGSGHGADGDTNNKLYAFWLGLD